MSVTLADVRTLVRDRADLSTNDPVFTDAIVNRQINLAYRKALRVQPDGWWWQHVEIDAQNTTGADLAVMPVAISSNRIVDKAYSVFVSFDGRLWEPIANRERADAYRLTGGVTAPASGMPLAYSVIPEVAVTAGVRHQIALAFQPYLPVGAWVRYIAVCGPTDLTADGSVLVGVPQLIVDMVVELAVVALLRQRREGGTVATRRRYANQLSLANTAAEDWIKAARVFHHAPYAGAGYGTMSIAAP